MPNKKRYQKNSEELRAARREFYSKNPERSRRASQEWRAKNREKHRAYQRAYYKKHSKEAKKYQKDWYLKHREECLTANKTRNNSDYPVVPSRSDWARLAAYIDGEGTIFIRGANCRDAHQLIVCISNTDRRLIDWLKNTFGGAAFHWKKVYPGRRPVSRWSVGRQKAAYFLHSCLPFFVIKKDQAEVAIAFQKTIKYGGRRAGTPADVMEKREAMRLELQRLKHYCPTIPELENAKIAPIIHEN